METSARRRLLGGLLFAGIVSACASLMGVEEPTLGDPSTALPDDARRDDGGFVDPDSGGCVGADCPCGPGNECRDLRAKTCLDGKCVECASGAGQADTCGLGRYCLGNQCAPGCKSDAECVAISGAAAPLCNLTRHQCVACLDASQCQGANQDCSPSGRCAEKCTNDGGACSTPGQTCCGGLCVDTTADIFNCGTCTRACGGASPSCCAGECKDVLTDVGNCGGCQKACVTTNGSPSCQAGACRWTCTVGFSHCTQDNTGCETKTSDDTLRCGSCTNDCNGNVKNAAGVSCAQSACTYGTCNSGYANCDNNRSNGCECVCGKTNTVCCPTGSACTGSDYCAGDNNCRVCKPKKAGCNFDRECCSDDCSKGKCK